ncbi:hypothetical protein EMIHUDRAFT_213831 [Emiliania huxleyi CCMP1516]|uniref:Uncharacterized protein n=2 Tax=Emiliania huxleyi TaxID=2903 RepID=A0A0D3ILE2_EMIH1|nr:hypothetical protein EMIHUDRAFT_213831 [Emiliania huxleyi CCMP1516]EOD12077.1 hypothetical protein EMIHUDRAFT_213831 [Emiliania huxleyi CCMP1516]|eukprot:XP_005764506.1 hypothetical protein EMIHUDRAFT_213831 [Emiliania huxleyi CCMP1516]
MPATPPRGGRAPSLRRATIFALALTALLVVMRSTHAAGAGEAVDDSHVRYEHVPLEQLRRRFVAKLGAGEAQASAKLSSGKGLSDLKPFYGHVFDDLLGGYTHWGWVDWDILLGDLAAVVGEEALWASDAVTFAGATLGFAWAGQLTIFRNSAETRELYRVDDNHLALGFKAPSPGGVRGAQMDYKAQWLTWVEWIQRDPDGFYRSKDRVCLRCCPHSLGVSYEGAFFHAGLSPTPAAPDCAAGTWALLDDIGRFSGQLRVLRGGRCESRRGRPNGTR